MNRDDERLPVPPAEASQEELREWGRQLAMDGLIERAFETADSAAGRSAFRRPRRARRLFLTAAAAAVAAAAAALLALLPGAHPPDQDGPSPTPGPVSRPGEIAVSRFEPPAGRSELATLPDGSTVEIAGGSLVRVTVWPDRPRPLVELDRGQVTCEVSKGLGRFTVRTPVGEAIALGTKYSVTLEGGDPGKAGTEGEAEVKSKAALALVMTVAVMNGEVLVRDLAGNEQLALAGAPAVKVGAEAPQLAAAEKFSSGQLVPRLEDGRQGDPLEVRKHSVKAAIREQIAFVEVDQTFYNPSDRRLEGTFFFPLPEGATITRLAMYVGDRLMEGEIAEAQRARRTFEALLVQRQDPALLEWAGGNNFKMRVFPIEPKSEKRVLISYYQVLKREHDRVLFSYPLASDSLQTHKVGRVEVAVTVESTPQIVSAETPGWDAKVQASSNSIEASWSAENASPERDFVLDYRLAHDQGELVTVPYWHERCGDGYFLMIFSPQLEDADSEKERSSRFVFVLDKSGGLGQRQLALGVKAVRNAIARLRPADRFGIVAYDAFARKFREELLPASPENVEAAGEWLASLDALGASDLGAAWRAAADLAGNEQAQVMYVGSGLSTLTSVKAGRLLADADAALAGRDVRLHCLALGDVRDGQFLAELARKYSGTVRPLASAEDAQSSVDELMDDYAWPLYRDVRLELLDVPTDEIYPVWFPNVAAGRQLFVYGRYYAQRKARVRLTASYKDRPYTREFEADLGGGRADYFVPKLWATRKIEHLQMENALAEGEASEGLVRTVVETSKRYRVMSQFTSFIVLETPEDYLRYGIERRRDEFAPGSEEGEIAELDQLPEQLGYGAAGGKDARRWALADDKGGGEFKRGEREVLREAQAPSQPVDRDAFPASEKSKSDESADRAAAEPRSPPPAPSAKATLGWAEAQDAVSGKTGLPNGAAAERKSLRGRAADFDTDVLAWARQDIFPTFGPTELGKLPRNWKRSDARALELLNSVAARFQSLAVKVNAFTLDKDGKEVSQGREWLVELDAATRAFVSYRAGDDSKDVCDGQTRWRLFPTLKYAARRAATASDLADLGSALPGYLMPWAERLDRDWLVTFEKREEGVPPVLRLARRGDEKYNYVLLCLDSDSGPVTKIEVYERRTRNRNTYAFLTRTIDCEEIKEIGGVKVPTVFRTTVHGEAPDVRTFRKTIGPDGRVSEERVETAETAAMTSVVRLSDLKVNHKPEAGGFKVEPPKDWAVRDLDAAPRAQDVKPVSDVINPSPNQNNWDGRR